jgi:hypothetical protein
LEGRKTRAFENRALWRIFGPKREEVTRNSRKLHNEKIDNLYYSSNNIRMIKQKTMTSA